MRSHADVNITSQTEAFLYASGCQPMRMNPIAFQLQNAAKIEISLSREVSPTIQPYSNGFAEYFQYL